MADEIERLLVRVEANATQFEAQMRKLNKSLYASQAENRKTLSAIQRDTEAASKRMFAPIGDAFRQEVAGMAASVAALFTTQQIIKYADDWTSARNALAAAGIATSDLADRQQQLVDLANETRTSTASTVELYSRLTRATSELGMTQSDVLRLTELLNKSFASSGLSTQEAASAALQLSQALASGQLQGDELRSLRENAPAVAQAIADAMGVGIGALKDLGAEGKLTASVVSSAILGAADDIEARFAATTTTVGQAITILNNELGRFIGETDQSLSATQRMAQGIVLLAENLDKVAGAAIIVASALGANLGGRAVGAAITGFTALRTQIAVTNAQLVAFELRSNLAAGAMGRMSVAGVAATGAMRGLSAAMAFFGGPIGLAITAVGAAVAGLAIVARNAEEDQQAFNEAMDESNRILKETDEILKKSAAGAKGVGEESAGAVGGINAMCDATKALADETYRLADAQAQAARTAIFSQVQKNRDRINELANPSLFRRGLYAAGTKYRGEFIQDRDRKELEALYGANAELLSRSIQLVTDPNARLIRGRPSTGGGGGGSTGGGSSRSSDADRIADLRERLSLEEDLARVRATGDDAAIKREEERQRIIEATNRYREAGYADAEQRAINLIAAENQAEDIAEQRERTQARIREGIEREAELKRAAADWTERQHSAELEIARLRGDESAIRRLEREAALRQRIAEYTERYGVAGVGMAVAEQLSFDQASAEGDMNYAAENAARTFVDVIAADDPWSAAGYAFKRAAFDNLENLFSSIFKDLMNNDKGGGLLGSIASGIGSFFSGGARATGGPVTAGRAYKINHNNPQSEWFVPGMNGSVLTNGQMRGLQTGGVRAAGGSLSVNVDVSGANGDEAVARIARQAAAEGTAQAIAQSRMDAANDRRASKYRLSGRG